MSKLSQLIQIFTSADGQVQLDITQAEETLWLSQVQISESRTTENFSVIRQEGARQVQRQIKHYNLDAVISLGYKVSSSRATQFRIWATSTT